MCDIHDTTLIDYSRMRTQSFARADCRRNGFVFQPHTSRDTESRLKGKFVRLALGAINDLKILHILSTALCAVWIFAEQVPPRFTEHTPTDRFVVAFNLVNTF